MHKQTLAIIEMEETSEYNSDSGDDLPNLNVDRQRVWQKYKYLNRADCPNFTLQEKSDQKDGLSDKNIPIVIVISTTYLSLRNGMN